MNLDQVKDILQLLGYLLVFVAAVAVVFGYGKVKTTDQMLQGLRGDRDDLQTRVARLEEEKKKLEDDNTKLHNEVLVLKDMVTNREVINTLVAAFERHDQVVAQRYDEYRQTIDHMVDILQSNQQQLVHILEGRSVG